MLNGAHRVGAALALRVRARPLTCFSAQDATGTDVLVVTKVKLNTPEGKKRRGPPQKASKALGPVLGDGLHVLWGGDEASLYAALRDLTQKVGERLVQASAADSAVTLHWPELRGAAAPPSLPALSAPPSGAATTAAAAP